MNNISVGRIVCKIYISGVSDLYSLINKIVNIKKRTQKTSNSGIIEKLQKS